jgi:hypothetical protein|tara:strand:+ start:330 stop:539 length:210 start_codon:yes stop_codon:yes gene_type:complete
MMSVFKPNCHHAYAQIDGMYNWPNSHEGDLLKQAYKEITELEDALLRIRNIANALPQNKAILRILKEVL